MVALINGGSKSRDSEDPKFQREREGGFVLFIVIWERESKSESREEKGHLSIVAMIN